MSVKHFFLSVAWLVCASLQAAPIDRQAVVCRHNPHVTRVDSLSALTVGNGDFAFTVDATGLQSFPRAYRHGVCLGTFNNSVWHRFPNTNHYRAEETWVARDFGRGHQERYAAQFKQPGRQHDAANYLRANPHRLHLGCIGLDLQDIRQLHAIDETLNLWTGTVTSSFRYGRQAYRVATVCAPDRDLIATQVWSNGPFAIRLRFPYPTGGHSDDGCDWEKDSLHHTYLYQRPQGWVVKRVIDSTTYYIMLRWQGQATITQDGANSLRIESHDQQLALQCEYVDSLPAADGLPRKAADGSSPAGFDDWQRASARCWKDYWTHGGFIDFGRVRDARARELERRVILSQYLMRAQECGAVPPQETGLTYNSWFGKFHLEMTWWHLAHFALWQRPALLDRPLSWYLKVAPQARAIAARQGFSGMRWMKMTDPSGAEAPSNTGSYLIWQQPHLIYLATLLYRAAGEGRPMSSAPNAAQQEVLDKYGTLVEQTAAFMGDFAQYDSLRHQFMLRGCIPAQETLSVDSTVNPPFELNYWLMALEMAQQWRERAGKPHRADWDRIIRLLPPLTFNSDSLYLAAASAVNTYTDRRFTSDHPAVLGALGMLPASRLTDDQVMRKTADWIVDHWNWPTCWGWDFPMMAMTYARLGDADRAVNALLMAQQKNTYLVNGHNWQDQRLRVYLPGNGGLLTAVAMMAAGWDGCQTKNPGFPADWDVQWENLSPMP